jgi:hypothetical protein
MSMTKLAIVLLACGLLAADTDQKSDPPDAPVQKAGRRPHIRFGGLSVGAGYSRWSGGWCCGYPYGLWSPFYSAYFWSPFFYQPYNSGFSWGPNMGQVKLHADLKDAEVFIDGAFAGTVSERKSMWLEPGAYNLEVRSPGRETYVKRIYVLSGKSLRVNAKMETP